MLHYRLHWRIVIPLGVLSLVLLAAFFAEAFAPFDPTAQHLADRLRPPSWEPRGDPRFLLGTDHLGRDVLSRLIYGARISLPIAFAATMAGALIGISLGLAAGFFRGAVDAVVTKLIDIQLSFPFVLFAIAVIAITGPNPVILVLVLAARSWTTFARVVRAETLVISGREFILAARGVGASQLRIITRHIAPNLLSIAIVIATLDIGTIIVLEATLSFIGLGVQPPTVSWGKELSDARQYIQLAWWTTTFPGIALLTVVLSVNMLGDSLRDILDPRLRT